MCTMNSARLVLMCFVLYLLVGSCVLEELKEEKSLLIRKCCRDGQQLSLATNLRKCVDYNGSFVYSTNNTQQAAISIMEKGNTGFPWWLNSEIKPMSSTTFEYVDSFLRGQDPSKYIEYGVKQPCNAFMTKIIDSNSDDYDLFDNGTLLFFPDAPNYNKSASFGPTSYCADRVEVEGQEPVFVFLLCPCSRMPCIRKCCPPHMSLSITDRRWDFKPECVRDENNTNWAPHVFDDNLQRLDAAEEDAVIFTTLNDFPVCGDERQATILNPEPNTSPLHLWVLRNGSALAQNYGRGVPFGPQHYCADESVSSDGARVFNAVFCNDHTSAAVPDADAQFYGALFVIGAVFLATTLLAFCLLPELRGSTHSKGLMAHTASFLVAYVALAVGQLHPKTPYVPCVMLAFVIQWSFLAAFFWLNVMCIDISWAFSGIRAPQGSMRDRDRKKFLYYSLYAWGSPTVISAITAVMEFVKAVPSSCIKPDFGVRTCWFNDKFATLAYFYGPMAVLLLGNLILFVFTAAKIIMVQCDTAILHENGHQDRQRFVLYAKLFVLMGLTWVTEIISWAHGNPLILWYVTDFINLLRAVYIFIMVCCKRRVLTLLRLRLKVLFPSWCPEVTPSDSGINRSKTSSSTQKTNISMTQINREKPNDRQSASD